MNKQVIVYYAMDISERAKKYLSKISKEDVKRLTSQFQQAITSKEERNYRFLYKGYLIYCRMSEDKYIRVYIDDIYKEK